MGRPKRRDTAGSTVELTADRASTRRYAQCWCGAREIYRDAPTLWAAGWGSTWQTSADPPRRIWHCPEHWIPPVLPDAPPSYELAPALLEVAALASNSRARRSLASAVTRLLATAEGRARGLAYLAQIVRHLGSHRAAGAWRALRTVPRPRG